MQVIFISECTKRALVETRRILDQFAERRGERTWQTTITWEGLKTVRRLLRRTARKNTAVACHWVRGVNQTELLWTVGNTRHFNERGAVPTDTSGKEIIRLADENDWHTGEIIYLLSAFSALLHDLGKSCDAFQKRLRKTSTQQDRNIYRHEWVSLRLLQAFVGNRSDKEWLQHMAETGGGEPSWWLTDLEKDGLDEQCSFPFKTLPPIAAAIGWLVVSHHRIPNMSSQGSLIQASHLLSYFQRIDSTSNQAILQPLEKRDIQPYWTFSQGLPIVNKEWQKRAKRLARRLLDASNKYPDMNWLDNLYVMHLSRLSLMLADYYYSSLNTVQERIQCQSETNLYANTNGGKLNQTLEEHLIGVALEAGYVTHSLPSLESSLPSLANHRGLRKRTTIARFKWQDKAADLAASVRDQAREQGAFFINMASTGCGKTLANARIMYALADPQKGARFSVALGLRTLTLQTGHAYQADRMHLDEDQLAIRVGGSASKELFEFYAKQAADTGSESRQDLMDEDGGVLFEGDYDSHPLLSRTLHRKGVKSLVAAPVLVCTVDHLTPATETVRGGRQIAPMLRLMTSDLVLDEIDDYGLKDLPALARLIHWAGLLGARVMLSSATLPPALVQGLFAAYRAGRQQYQENRGEFGQKLQICTAWFDEHECLYAESATEEEFSEHHKQFAQQRAARLYEQVRQGKVRRTAVLIPVEIATTKKKEFFKEFAQHLLNSALTLHKNNSLHDPKTGKKVSFGLIRMANIGPLVQTALALFSTAIPKSYRIHLCVYHSQYPLLIRSAMERELDQVLNRSDPLAVLSQEGIQMKLAQSKEPEHLFIVLGSPVTEVGRDHDYDWAIIEPSSMRSMIQLVGRIRRHRPEAWSTINVHILARNVNSFEPSRKLVFYRPGFETEGVQLKSRDLHDLLKKDEWQYLDSRPRLIARAPLDPTGSLVDIEHYQLEQAMLPQLVRVGGRRGRETSAGQQNAYQFGAHSWWTGRRSTLMTVMQVSYPFRQVYQEQESFVLLPNEDENDFVLHRIQQDSKHAEIYTDVEQEKLQRVSDQEVYAPQVEPWFSKDFLELLEEQAEAEDIDLLLCAKKYGVLSLPRRLGYWHYHPALGFYWPLHESE